MKRQAHPILTGALILTATGLASRVIGFFYRIYLSHLIGAEGMGIYQMISPVSGVCFALCCGGADSGLGHQRLLLQAAEGPGPFPQPVGGHRLPAPGPALYPVPFRPDQLGVRHAAALGGGGPVGTGYRSDWPHHGAFHRLQPVPGDPLHRRLCLLGQEMGVLFFQSAEAGSYIAILG